MIRLLIAKWRLTKAQRAYAADPCLRTLARLGGASTEHLIAKHGPLL